MREIRAKAVIGAGYGDEGKGLLTDLMAAESAAGVVVRSNGGAQAGHTVLAPDGRRHVFHHFGSGALAGVPTHLSAHFVAHPMMMLGERAALERLGANVTMSSDPRAIVTTPFDMMINQAVELARGNGRHGSCGLGFGETIERSLRPAFSIRTGDLFRPDLRQRLAHIWAEWVPLRLAMLGLTALPASIAESLDVDGIIDRFIIDCADYLDCVALWPDARLAGKGTVIFEGAQGLMLDQDHGAFPHVTRSNTGLRNMLDIAAQAGIAGIDAVYATRCYTTRHGAGPLAHETVALDGIVVDDPTNAPNDWQGTIRLAPLDLAVLRGAIARDLALAEGSDVVVTAALAVTCLDQVVDRFTVRDGETSSRLTAEAGAIAVAEGVGMPLFGESRGADRGWFRRAVVSEKVA